MRVNFLVQGFFQVLLEALLIFAVFFRLALNLGYPLGQYDHYYTLKPSSFSWVGWSARI